MSQAILATTELDSGDVWAYIPASQETEISEDLATFLASGGIFSPEEARNSWEHLFRKSQFSGGLLIVEDELASPGDPFLERFRGSFATNDSDVFHWLVLSSKTDAVEVERFIHSRSSGYPLNAFLVDSSADSLPVRLGSGIMETLVACVEAIFVSAWDGESLVVWRVGRDARAARV